MTKVLYTVLCSLLMPATVLASEVTRRAVLGSLGALAVAPSRPTANSSVSAVPLGLTPDQVWREASWYRHSLVRRMLLTHDRTVDATGFRRAWIEEPMDRVKREDFLYTVRRQALPVELDRRLSESYARELRRIEEALAAEWNLPLEHVISSIKLIVDLAFRTHSSVALERGFPEPAFWRAYVERLKALHPGLADWFRQQLEEDRAELERADRVGTDDRSRRTITWRERVRHVHLTWGKESGPDDGSRSPDQLAREITEWEYQLAREEGVSVEHMREHIDYIENPYGDRVWNEAYQPRRYAPLGAAIWDRFLAQLYELAPEVHDHFAYTYLNDRMARSEGTPIFAEFKFNPHLIDPAQYDALKAHLQGLRLEIDTNHPLKIDLDLAQAKFERAPVATERSQGSAEPGSQPQSPHVFLPGAESPSRRRQWLSSAAKDLTRVLGQALSGWHQRIETDIKLELLSLLEPKCEEQLQPAVVRAEEQAPAMQIEVQIREPAALTRSDAATLAATSRAE